MINIGLKDVDGGVELLQPCPCLLEGSYLVEANRRHREFEFLLNEGIAGAVVDAVKYFREKCTEIRSLRLSWV